MIYNFIIKLLVVQSLAVSVSSTLNVRTALFTSADLKKKEWSARDVALLRARMYLQDLIPPIEVSQSPEYVNSLIRYIRDCYDSVNRAASDRETEAILTDALSDVLGGYLKMIALPVTKSVFYSGDLPTHKALQIFKHYEDIKHHLRTRGTGWSDQVMSIIKTNNIRGARSQLSAMKIKEPCQRLLYLQNNQQNLSMPMPSIDWNTRMMFIPLTDQPLVDLRCPSVTHILQQFHKVATACERSIVPDKHNFQDSFDDWVNQEVLPHLSDDDLYTAFKGILSIIENSKSPMYLEEKSSLLSKCVFNLSTNAIIIIGILILEVICCIPTLLYVVNKRNSKKDPKVTKPPQVLCPCSTQPTEICYVDKAMYRLDSHNSPCNSQDRTSAADFTNYKKFVMNSKTNSDLSSVSGSRRSYSSITDVPTVVEEIPPTNKYAKRNKKIQPSRLQLFSYQTTETDRIDVTQGQTQVSTRTLYPKATSTSISINTAETVTRSTIERDTGTVKELRKSKRFRKRAGSSGKIESNSPLTNSQCRLPLANVTVSGKSEISKTAEELKLELFDDRLWDKALRRVRNEKKVEFTTPYVSLGKKASKNLSEVGTDQPLKTLQSVTKKQSVGVLDILDKNNGREVENPNLDNRETGTLGKQTNVHILAHKDSELTTKIWKGILKCAEEKTIIKKTSKIPKRINSIVGSAEVPRSVKPAQHLPSPRHKSMIPTLKRALDDSAILSSSPRDTKFNITL